MELEERFRIMVTRAYAVAGLRLAERDACSLARVYADWASGAACDEAAVLRKVERALLASLGAAAA